MSKKPVVIYGAICSPTGTPTFGSTQTIFSTFESADKAFYLENNQRVYWPPAVGYETVLRDRPRDGESTASAG